MLKTKVILEIIKQQWAGLNFVNASIMIMHLFKHYINH